MSGNIELQNLRVSPNVPGHQANRADGGDLIVNVDDAMSDQSQNSAVEGEISPRGEDSDNSSGTNGPRFCDTTHDSDLSSKLRLTRGQHFKFCSEFLIQGLSLQE
jgi:hypothetical protein